MTILRFRYAETSCPVAIIAAIRTLTGRSIADIRHCAATSQPLFEIVMFRSDWDETKYKLVRIAKQIADGTLPLIVTEESNGVVTPVPLLRLQNMIQHFRQIELETQMDIALEIAEIDDPVDFIAGDADWTQ